MISATQIKPDMPVLCSMNGKFATVDHMDGSDMIKLKKDKAGDHHFIPLSWVTSVDDKVHIDRPGDQAMKEWSTWPTDRDKKAANDGATTEGMRGKSPEDRHSAR